MPPVATCTATLDLGRWCTGVREMRHLIITGSEVCDWKLAVVSQNTSSPRCTYRIQRIADDETDGQEWTITDCN